MRITPSPLLADALRAGLQPGPSAGAGAAGGAGAAAGAAAAAGADLGLAPDQAARVLVLGAGGPLGSAVLEALLALLPPHPSARGAPPVVTLVQRRLDVALRGLAAWQLPAWAGAASATDRREREAPADDWPATPPPPHWRADTAVLVFDREQGSRHGREAAFVRPQPQQLAAIGAWLRLAGVQRLLVLLPQAPGLLPPALRAGLANLDEQALVAQGFTQLVIVRPARHGAHGAAVPVAASRGGRLLQRVAQAVLAQLHWMVPLREQPLRPRVVGRFVGALVQALADATPGTRVVAADLLWAWAQPGGGEPLLQAWLNGMPPPAVPVPRQRW